MFRKETMMYLYFAEQSIFSLGFSITSYKMTVFLLGEELMVQAKRDENVLISILMNIVLPSLVLTKGTAYLGADRALALGIALPIGYFAWDYYARRETSMMSLLGLASVIASGALGMFRATGLWFAVKEALLPSVLGLATLMSLSWRKPLIHAFVYSDMIFHKDRIEQALSEKGTDKIDDKTNTHLQANLNLLCPAEFDTLQFAQSISSTTQGAAGFSGGSLNRYNYKTSKFHLNTLTRKQKNIKTHKSITLKKRKQNKNNNNNKRGQTLFVRRSKKYFN
jgi:hypothetical protein